MVYHPERWQDQLATIECEGRLRKKPVVGSAQTSEIDLNGRRFVNFASNDYLGLANHEGLRNAASEAIAKYGLGSAASAMVCGYTDQHEALETELAAFLGRDRALLFSTGYMANLSVLATLSSANGIILQDKLNHASLIDGAKLAGARSQRYLHSDPLSLRKYLNKYQSERRYDSVTVATDGVFSMDGDCAELGSLASVCNEFDATLVVDDAHGLGVLGKGGRGTLSSQSIGQEDCPVLVGTFGKAFGGFGAFVSGPDALIEYLEQTARPHIYTTALPVAIVAAMRESLLLIEKADDARKHLHELIAHFRSRLGDEGLNLLKSQTPIQGVVAGSNDAVMKLSGLLRDKGFLVGAIRPPTVPPNSARLRITLSAGHTFDQLNGLIEVLCAAKRTGLCS